MHFNLAPLEPDKPYHVLVTYKPGLLVCYLDGKIASQTSFENGSFDKWHGSSYSLIFGNEVGGVRPWEGYLDGVAIYSRFVDPEEAARKFKLAGARIAQRPKIDRKIVKAEMLHLEHLRARHEPVVALERGAARSKTQKQAIALSVILNLAVLGFFKYFNFGVEKKVRGA